MNDYTSSMVNDTLVATKIVDNAVSSHEGYFKTIENHQRHLDLAPPFDPVKLRAAGMAWRSNFSFAKARGKVEKLSIDAIGTVYGSLGMGSVRFRRFEKGKHGSDASKQWMRDEFKREQYANDVVSVYADVFEEDERTPDFVSRVCYNQRAFGVGYVLKEPGKSMDWMGEAYDIRSVMFPKRKRVADIDKAVLLSNWPILRFWQRYESMTDGSSWNVEGLEELFAHYHDLHDKELNPGNSSFASANSEKEWAAIASTFSGQVNLLDQISDDVQFSKILSEEPDGSTTVTYFAYVGSSNVGSSNVTAFTPKHFLYQKNFPNKKVTDILFIIRDSGVTTTGYVQDMRGITQFAVPDSHRHNLDRNSLRDKTLLSGNMLFKQSTANQGQKLALTVSSVAVIAPQGFELSKETLNPNLGPLLTAMQAEEESYLRETQHHDSSLAGKLGDRATTREVDRIAAEVEGARQSKVAVSMRDWARLHASNINDLIKLSYKDGDIGKESRDYFFDELLYLWCLENEKQVQAILEEFSGFSLEVIQANPDALRESIRIAQSEFGRNELGRQLLTALGNPRRRVDRVMKRLGSSEIITEDQNLAELQNQIFWTRGGVLINRNANPVAQLSVHFKLFDDAIASVKQGGDPVAIGNFLANGLQHTAKLLILAEEDMFHREVFPTLLEKQKELEGIKNQVVAMAKAKAKEMAEQKQAQQGQLDPATERRLRIEEVDASEKRRRTDENQQATRKLKEDKAEFDKELKSKVAGADVARKSQVAGAEVEIKRRTAESN